MAGVVHRGPSHLQVSFATRGTQAKEGCISLAAAGDVPGVIDGRESDTQLPTRFGTGGIPNATPMQTSPSKSTGDMQGDRQELPKAAPRR